MSQAEKPIPAIDPLTCQICFCYEGEEPGRTYLCRPLGGDDESWVKVNDLDPDTRKALAVRMNQLQNPVIDPETAEITYIYENNCGTIGRTYLCRPAGSDDYSWVEISDCEPEVSRLLWARIMGPPSRSAASANALKEALSKWKE